MTVFSPMIFNYRLTYIVVKKLVENRKANEESVDATDIQITHM